MLSMKLSVRYYGRYQTAPPYNSPKKRINAHAVIPHERLDILDSRRSICHISRLSISLFPFICRQITVNGALHAAVLVYILGIRRSCYLSSYDLLRYHFKCVRVTIIYKIFSAARSSSASGFVEQYRFQPNAVKKMIVRHTTISFISNSLNHPHSDL